MTEPRHTASTITDYALEELYTRLDFLEDVYDMAATDVHAHRLCPTTLQAKNHRAERAEAAVARVRALYRAVTYYGQQICAECSAYDGHASTDNHPAFWPCATLTALAQAGTEGTNSPKCKED